MLKKKSVTKVALVVSIFLIVIWLLLSARASLAWFHAEDSIVNTLHFGNLDVNLYHKTNTGYETVDGNTKVFSESALYEPGYTQIVCLKIENAGAVDFNYDMSVVPDMSTLQVGKTESGEDIILPEHLNFGLVFASSEDALLEKIADRELAKTYATTKLSDYSGSGGSLTAGSSDYCALILYMPTEVANEANYRGDTPPKVDVGISVVANASN
ncbi:MAG: hypothetical protein KBS52_00915 [Clostridiales bacterium]|nr:hypothetical protein [Candidatus Equinaster intestinalis]